MKIPDFFLKILDEVFPKQGPSKWSPSYLAGHRDGGQAHHAGHRDGAHQLLVKATGIINSFLLRIATQAFTAVGHSLTQSITVQHENVPVTCA